MEKCIEVIKDNFIDYAGKKHYFVIAAISVELAGWTVSGLRYSKSGASAYAVIDVVPKGIKIGYAICNPLDKFEEKIGVERAIGRARKSNPSIFTTHKGYVNTKTVRALLESEAEFLKKNPELYIAGYKDAMKAYKKDHPDKEKPEFVKIGE